MTHTVTVTVALTEKQEQALKAFKADPLHRKGFGPEGTLDYDAIAFDKRILNPLEQKGLVEFFVAPCGQAVRLSRLGVMLLAQMAA